MYNIFILGDDVVMKINVYDFDKTIYSKDSSIEFFLFCLRKKPYIFVYIPGIITLLFLNKIKVLKIEKTKSYFFKFIKFFSDNVDKIVNEFWSINKKYIRYDLIKDNNYNVVISASPTFLLKNICNDIGINKLIASKVDINTGTFIGKNCHDVEKLNRLNSEINNYCIDYFYSDSYSDNCLAALAKNPYIIKNGKVKKWYD